MRYSNDKSEQLIDKYFPVLDNGFIALKDYMGGDDAIVESARVSYGKGTKTPSDDKTLIRYLMRNKHTTPIEMVQFKFHISMPIHCHRQFIRHRMSTTNEYSARYSEVPEVLYDNYELALQSKNNKQGRSEDFVDDNSEEYFKTHIKANENTAFILYNDMLKAGVAREIARMHLPLNCYTYFYWKIDLHNLFHFLRLRCDSHAQFEIRQYANILAGIVKECCPIAFEAWYDYVFSASNWTRLDKLLQEKREKLIELYGPDTEMDTYETGSKLLKYSKEIGMSKREYDEFWQKLSIPEHKDFQLDFSTVKTTDFYENLK